MFVASYCTKIVMVQVFWGIRILASNTTCLHIAAFSFLRLLSVGNPHVFSWITLKHAKVRSNLNTVAEFSKINKRIYLQKTVK